MPCPWTNAPTFICINIPPEDSHAKVREHLEHKGVAAPCRNEAREKRPRLYDDMPGAVAAHE